MRVSQVNDRPVPMEIPVTLMICRGNKDVHQELGSSSASCCVPSKDRSPYRNGQRHARQLYFPKVTAEHHADETDQEDHELGNDLEEKRSREHQR